MGYDSTGWLLLALLGMSQSRLTVASFVVLAESIWLIHTCGCPLMGVLCGGWESLGLCRGTFFLVLLCSSWSFLGSGSVVCFCVRVCAWWSLLVLGACVRCVLGGSFSVYVLPSSLFPPLPPNISM